MALDLRMTTLKRNNLVLVFFVLLIAAIDQTSKAFAVFYRPHLDAVIDGFLYLTLSFNSGSLWGIFAQFPYLLAIFGCAAICCIVCFYQRLHVDKHPVLYGLIIGGILGNTIDRFLFGYVIDFIDVDLHFYRWPIFNIADVAINVGIFYWILWAKDNKTCTN